MERQGDAWWFKTRGFRNISLSPACEWPISHQCTGDKEVSVHVAMAILFTGRLPRGVCMVQLCHHGVGHF